MNPINTTKVTGRRRLRFESLEELEAEVQQRPIPSAPAR